MTAPTISFVTVNFNSGAKTCALIDSIRRHAVDAEIIVVDNASSDNTRALLDAAAGADLRCIYNDKNLGYGKANNIGVSAAKAPLVVLVNPDAVFLPNAEINSYFQKKLSDLAVGALAPKIVYPDGSPQPNFANRYTSIQTFIAQLFSLGKLYRFIKSRGWGSRLAEKLGAALFGAAGREYTNRFDAVSASDACAWVSGACLGMRKSTFDAVGGFDDKFFLYSEDEDLCRRIRERGLTICYDPALTLVHEVGGTDIVKRSAGQLGWGEFHKIYSGLMYLRKYNVSSWFSIKMAYTTAVLLRLIGGLYVMFSPIRSVRLVWLLLKI
jgi:GT2 family glycosyltransferase